MLSRCLFSHSKVNSPKRKTKQNKLPPEFLSLPDKLFWIWGQVLDKSGVLGCGYTERYLLRLQQKPFRIPILDISCSVTEFQACQFQLLFPLVSPEESTLSPHFQDSSEVRPDLITKERKDQHIFLPNSHFSGSDIILSLPFR